MNPHLVVAMIVPTDNAQSAPTLPGVKRHVGHYIKTQFQQHLGDELLSYKQQTTADPDVVSAYVIQFSIMHMYGICRGKIAGRKGHQAVTETTKQDALWLVSPTEAMTVECNEALKLLELVESKSETGHNKFYEVKPTVFPLRQNECIATEEAVTALTLLEERPWSKGRVDTEGFVAAVQNIAQLQNKIAVPDLNNLEVYEDTVTVMNGMPQGNIEGDGDGITEQVQAMNVDADQSPEVHTASTTCDEKLPHTIENWRDYISKVFLQVYLQGTKSNGVVLWGEHVIPGEQKDWPEKVEAMTPRERGEAAGKLMEFLYGQCKP